MIRVKQHPLEGTNPLLETDTLIESFPSPVGDADHLQWNNIIGNNNNVNPTVPTGVIAFENHAERG